jgi:hypothetical protein
MTNGTDSARRKTRYAGAWRWVSTERAFKTSPTRRPGEALHNSEASQAGTTTETEAFLRLALNVLLPDAFQLSMHIVCQHQLGGRQVLLQMPDRGRAGDQQYVGCA